MENITYEAAMERLANITKSLEQGTLNIDELSDQLKEAQELLAFCKQKLTKVETDVNQILSPQPSNE